MKSWHQISLQRILDVRGSLTFIEGKKHLPFEIARVYYLYDVPSGESRGAHAHRKLEQLFIAASGSFDIVLDDGHKKETITLRQPYNGLYVPELVWRDLNNFSSGSVCLVLASRPYEETDYIRDYTKFLELVEAGE